MEYTTGSGLLVADHRHHRASEVPQVDPRSHDPNANVATGSVGPQSVAGGTIMGPSAWHAEAWDGWPSQWGTPYAGEQWSGTGYGRDPMWGRVSTAMTCVDLNSRQLASFPLYGMRGAVPTPLPKWSLNPEPSIYSSWSDFMHQVVNSMELRGEAFTYVTGRYADGYPSRFVCLNPDAVRVEWIGGRIEYLVDESPVDGADICHLRYQSWPGRLHGISPLEWAARSLATAAALERYATNLSTRGGVPWAVLKSQKNLAPEQVADAQASWVAASVRRDGAPAILGSAFDLQPLSFSPDQMALLGLREFDERRICAAFGVPAYLVNVEQSGGMTYANASDLRTAHWQSTLRPLAQTIAEGWSSWLMPAGTLLEFNPDRYVQPPFAERVTGYQTMHNIVDPATGEHAMTVVEIRAAERLMPEPTTAAEGVPLYYAQRLTGSSQ